jgi:hypothetical protein
MSPPVWQKLGRPTQAASLSPDQELLPLCPKFDCSFYIGGSPQTPELQVGQLESESSVALEFALKNEEKSLRNSRPLHFGQFKSEPSAPMDWRTSNLSPHSLH